MTTKTKHPQELSDVLITDEFFVPLAIDMKGLHRSQVFLGLWKRFASEIPDVPWFDVPVPRILRAIDGCKPKDALEAARIIASLIAWFGTSVGHCFVEKLFIGVDRSKDHWQRTANADLAISLWAKENSLYVTRVLRRPRLLKIIIRPTGDVRPLTSFEIDVAEWFMTYLTTDKDGHALLWKLEQASKSLQRAEREKILLLCS